MLFKRKRNCLHEWHEVGSRVVWEDSEHKEYIVVFCPLCDKEQLSTKNELDIELRKNELRKEYRG